MSFLVYLLFSNYSQHNFTRNVHLLNTRALKKSIQICIHAPVLILDWIGIQVYEKDRNLLRPVGLSSLAQLLQPVCPAPRRAPRATVNALFVFLRVLQLEHSDLWGDDLLLGEATELVRAGGFLTLKIGGGGTLEGGGLYSTLLGGVCILGGGVCGMLGEQG